MLIVGSADSKNLTHNGLPQGAGREVLVLVVRRARGQIEFGERHAHLLDVGSEEPVPHEDLQVHLRRQRRYFMEC